MARWEPGTSSSSRCCPKVAAFGFLAIAVVAILGVLGESGAARSWR
jgi:hypothetical protein